MSGRNHYRAAVACHKLTGWRYGRCVDLERHGLISPRQPVPDASTANQRRFEAQIVSVLANALRDRQLGAAFGVARVFPAARSPVLCMHPEMANRVLWELLPRWDSGYGGIRGVPGMRMQQQDGKITLRDLLSQSRVLVTGPADPRSMMHKLTPLEQPLWLDGKKGLHHSEAEDRASFAASARLRPEKSAGQDWLLSRMLRRPALVNRTCARHGLANTYTHADDDLVIEWCCDHPPAELAGQLRDSGVTAWPDDPRLGPRRPSPPGDPGTLWLCGTGVTLRRGYCSGDSTDLAGRVKTRRDWYR
jgi:hypothetical protein